jgi:uncharacterized protein YaiI (UPF0178 family)
MRILVDADSCPRPVRELIIRTSNRIKIMAVFAANHPIPGISGENASMEICPPGEGSADDRIVELAQPGDLAVTRDIPLAERLVEAQVRVMDDRGTVYTKENIRYCRSLRDFSLGLANNGLGPERIALYGKKELKSFADSFDRELTKLRTYPSIDLFNNPVGC